MLPFFKKNKKNEPEINTKESAVPAGRVVDFTRKAEEIGKSEKIRTTLNIPAGVSFSEEDHYAFRFLNNQCDPLSQGMLSILGLHFQRGDAGKMHFSVFIRHTHEELIELKELPVVILDKNDKVLARKRFNLAKLGPLPPGSSTPWILTYLPKELYTDEFTEGEWYAAFDIKPSQRRHRLELEDSWKQTLSQEHQDMLAATVSKMPDLNPGEINLTGLNITKKNGNELHAAILLRNGTESALSFEKLPLKLEDANMKTVTDVAFQLNPPLVVQPNTSKPWNFVFKLQPEEDPDLSSWRVSVIEPPKH